MDSLVDDVLLEAFTYLAERSRQSFSNILAASHVCPRWRKLALACPELWQRFPFLTQLDKPGGPEYDREFTTEILRRCGSLTLDVGWEHYAQECDKGPVTVLREMALSHRLRSYKIAIHTTLYFWAEIHVALARQQAHELQELSIVDHLTSTGWAILPILSIFNNKLPSLQSLSMTRCYVDLEQIQTPHLEELTIETGHITGDSVHLPQSLLGALAAHSNLTRLCIRINTTFTATLSQERVEMTRLVDLDLAGDFPTIQSFFEHVSIPRLQKLKIRFWGPPLPNRSMEECLTECMGKLLPCVPVSSTSLPSTLSFLRCHQIELEGVFSPQLHDLPFWSRDSNANDITFIFCIPQWFRDTPLLTIVANGWLFYGDRVQCLELPDDALAPSDYGGVFKDFILNPLASFKTIICTPQWERRLVRDGLGDSGLTFIHPPFQGVQRWDSSPELDCMQSDVDETRFEIDPV